MGYHVRMKSSPRAARLYLAGVAVLGLAFLVFAQAAFDLVPFGGALVRPTFPDHIVLLYVLSTFVFLILTVFAFILSRSLFKLLMERRMGRPGARFKTRLVMSMTALTLLPAFFLFAFAFGLVNRSIDKWFSVPVDSFFRTTTEIQAVWAAEHRANAEGILRELARAVPDDLGQAAANLNLDAIAIVRPDGTVLDSSAGPGGSTGGSDDSLEGLARRARDTTSAPGPLLAETGRGLEGIVRLPGWAGEEEAFLVALFNPDERFETLARTIATDSQNYRTLREDQLWYRDLYVYILVLMTVLLLFAAVWTGLFLSKKITVPIEALSVATREISSGNLDHRVHVDAEDELESLVGLFNDMAAKLQHTTAELDQRRRYTDTVLEAVPTGVISVDDEYRVTRINRAARTMFSADHAETLAEIFSPDDLDTIGELLRVCVQEGTTTREFRLQTERTASESRGDGIQSAVIANRLSTGGFVLVIEDLTDVVKAQKATAWREVARQLAHEIKNPLTPIQLSAERISRNLERASHSRAQPGSFDRRTADVIRECVDSIVSEVEGLKSLVNEFGRVARLPAIAQKPEAIQDLVGRTLALYEGRLDDVEVAVDIPPDLPSVLMDGRQIKRVLINLIDNALEAMQDRPAKRLGITCGLVRDRTMARLTVTDSGHGVAPEDRDRLFAPYFSTRKDGTGLGLAIASRIVVDHGGYIGTESNGGGARFIVDLPVWRES